MSEKNTPKTEPQAQFSQDFIQFYDEFSEFNDQCAFVLVALSCLLSDEATYSDNVQRGADCWSFWLRRRLGELQQKLRLLEKTARKSLSS